MFSDADKDRLGASQGSNFIYLDKLKGCAFILSKRAEVRLRKETEKRHILEILPLLVHTTSSPLEQPPSHSITFKLTGCWLTYSSTYKQRHLHRPSESLIYFY